MEWVVLKVKDSCVAINVIMKKKIVNKIIEDGC